MKALPACDDMIHAPSKGLRESCCSSGFRARKDSKLSKQQQFWLKAVSRMRSEDAEKSTRAGGPCTDSGVAIQIAIACKQLLLSSMYTSRQDTSSLMPSLGTRIPANSC